MLKWVGRFLFIMFVFIATVPVLQYANYSMLEKFYVEELKGEENTPEEYLVGISTMFGMDYYQKDPILSFEGIGDQQFNLDLHLFGVKEDKDYLNGVLLYLYNVNIKDDQSNPIVDPTLKIVVELDQPTFSDDLKTFSTTNEVVIDPSNTLVIPMMFLFDSEGNLKVKDEETYASIKSITVLFSDGTVDDDKNLVYNDKRLVYIANEIFDEPSLNPSAYHYAEIELLAEDYQLRDQFAESEPTDAEVIAFNLSLDKDNIKPYNWIIWRTIIIYILIVLVIAYFLFIHKHVMERRRNKIYDAQSNNPDKIIVDAIFKDEVENTKDGK